MNLKIPQQLPQVKRNDWIKVKSVVNKYNITKNNEVENNDVQKYRNKK
jgi:hypothetical protein